MGFLILVLSPVFVFFRTTPITKYGVLPDANFSINSVYAEKSYISGNFTPVELNKPLVFTSDKTSSETIILSGV